MLPDFLSRIVASGRAAWAAWNSQALIPTQAAGWEGWTNRLFRYELYDQYYSNNVYSFSDRYSPIHKSAYELYKNIRAIENPVNRLVELYVAKIYGGNIDMQRLSAGAIPFIINEPLLLEAIIQGFKWSNWGTQKSIYTRKGATYGDVGLKIVDDREMRQARLEVLDPRKIKHAAFDRVGNVEEIHIEYYAVEEADTVTPGGLPSRQMYLYTEVITPDSFATFKNGNPFAYYSDANDRFVPEWPNEYGFVPVSMTQHRNVGLNFGMNGFQPSLRKIDELNDLTSLLDDSIRKHVNVLWYFAGVTAAKDLTADTTSRDQFPAVYGPKDSRPEPMVAPLDIAAVTAHINELLQELERDMPELALHRLREKGLATAPGVRASYSDAIDRIVEARGNYDAGLVRAIEMQVRIGGYNGYENFEAFSLNSELDFAIADRPVIEDELPKQEMITALGASGAPKEAVWAALGIPEEKIKEWNALLIQQAAMQMMMAQRQAGLAGGAQQQPQLTDGKQPAPTIKGEPLPPDEATAETPIDPVQAAAWNKQFEAMKVAFNA